MLCDRCVVSNSIIGQPGDADSCTNCWGYSERFDISDVSSTNFYSQSVNGPAATGGNGPAATGTSSTNSGSASPSVCPMVRIWLSVLLIAGVVHWALPSVV